MEACCLVILATESKVSQLEAGTRPNPSHLTQAPPTASLRLQVPLSGASWALLHGSSLPQPPPSPVYDGVWVFPCTPGCALQEDSWE